MSLAVSETPPSLPRLSISYDPTDPDASALRIILTLRPEWKQWERHISFTRFTDGITNTLLKAENKRPGLSKDDIDREAILLRAYGNGTDVLIDRNRETTSHFVCAKQGLAPPLFARIDNGLLYKFIPGSACSAPDLRRPEVWRGVARRLGHWHASLPVSSISSVPSRENRDGSISSNKSPVERLLPQDIPRPNIWTVTESWITALPKIVPCTPERQAMLQRELEYIVSGLSKTPGICNTPYVFAHNDLLSGNVIIESSTDRQRRSSEQDAIVPPSQGAGSTTSSRSGTPASSLHGDDALPISFIDYEYANASPAAFDIANHFSEWGGLECEYKALPTKSQRREFLIQYISSFCRFRARDSPAEGIASSSVQNLSEKEQEAQLEQLFQEVDQFRGVPGFYWGIWALIQSGISSIDFDYATYAELRLGEYWDWKENRDSVRERRWAEE